jgi:MFS family permease
LPIAGLLADRFHRKNMLTIGTAPYALFGRLPAVLKYLNSILIARLVFGCVEAVIMTCCTTVIADYSNGEERSKYLIAKWLRLGFGSIFFVIGAAVGETSWR